MPPDSRVTLLDRLEPPQGHVVSHVVGTTYTLDLDSALLPSLALSRSASAASADPLETIAAVQASIDKIDVFHQRGMIAVPTNRSRLHTLLEPALHAVQHSPKYLFHPKLWVARYESEATGEIVFRLLVLSRNLSRSRSWDVAITLDGVLENGPSAKNKPIVDLLRYLTTSVQPNLEENRAVRIAALAEELRRVRWDLPTGATDLTFHVFGVRGSRAPEPDFSGYKHLVVSPFLTDGGLTALAEYARGPVSVVSRQESFDALSDDMVPWITDPFVLSPTAGIPADDQESTGGPTLAGLHAKLFCVERDRRAHLFIGSANATDNAFGGNIEVLVELAGKTGIFGVDALLGKGGFGSILQLTTIESVNEPSDDPQFALDQQLRQLIFSIQLRAELSGDEDNYALHVTSAESISIAQGLSLTISLLSDKATSAAVDSTGAIDCNFAGLRLSDVTAFFVLTVSDEDGRRSSAVLMAELINDVDARMSSIVTSEISTPDAFRRFLALLLAFGAPSVAVDSDGDEAGEFDASGRWNVLENGLFEQMLRVSTSNEQVLEHLAGVVTSIISQDDPNGVLPEGFRELWSAVYHAVEEGMAING
nr:phospholipase D family protein [Rhodococcus sp. B10]